MWRFFVRCKQLLKLLFVINLVFSCILFGCYLPTIQKIWLSIALENRTNINEDALNNASKVILIWNGFSRFELAVFGEGQEPFSSCPVSNCYLTKNKTLKQLEEMDALIFNMPTINSFHLPSAIQRKPEQRYIFFTQESPYYLFTDMDLYRGFFNWTMSYASYSDVQFTYGQVDAVSNISLNGMNREKYLQETHHGMNYAQGKTKLVAWFSSHCYTNSMRERYVNKLKKHIQVDMYGGCHSLRCPFNHTAYLSHSECYEMLEKDYKFYLAFENSLCEDYITEKFFDILQRRLIPVVLGGGNYSKIAPHHSYIDAMQYSPQELADYLLLLASNDILYNEYFWWKSHYKIQNRYPAMKTKALCQLCEKLHHNHSVTIYHDLQQLWGFRKQCHRPKYKGMFNLWSFF